MRETGGRTRREIINMPWTHNERPREAVCLFSDGSSSTPGMSAVSLFCPGLLDLPLLPLFPFYFKRTRDPSPQLPISFPFSPSPTKYSSLLSLLTCYFTALFEKKKRKKERNFKLRTS